MRKTVSVMGLLAVAGLFTACVVPAANQEEDLSTSVYEQQTEIRGPGYQYDYQVQFKLQPESSLVVAFEMRNRSSAHVLLLWQEDFFVSLEKGCLTVRMGSTASHYGNDIPRLEEIDRSGFFYQEVVEIPDTQKTIKCLEFVFFSLIDVDSGLAPKLLSLKADPGVWFTLGDLELTERYFDRLQPHALQIPLGRDELPVVLLE